MELDNSVKGKVTSVSEVDGTGITDHIGFIALPTHPNSLSYGHGELFFRDKCELADGSVVPKQGDTEYRINLEEITAHTFKNGVTGGQVLEAIKEATILARMGVFKNKITQD